MATTSQSNDNTQQRRVFFASQPQLVLLHEKDSEYVAQLATQITDVLDALKYGRWTTVLAPEIQAAATLLYYGMTIGRGHQTLGQEYVDSFMALETQTSTSIRVSAMTPIARAILVMVRTLMVYLSNRSDYIYSFASKLMRSLRLPFETPSSDKLLGVLRLLSNIHLFYFFANGRFYDYAMRFAGVRMLTNQQFKTSREQLQYQSLVLVLGLRLLLEMMTSIRHMWTPPPLSHTQPAPSDPTEHHDPSSDTHDTIISEEDDSQPPVAKCPLCMGPLNTPSTTPCGHIFCWTCVMSWCQTNHKGECAICRRPVKPQDILPLYNYGSVVTQSAR